ncbi:Chromatin structure-remodeling complex protein rsc9 [Lithohypha guttulata]|uniref:Chromatin structure-remodeling complex protein rsc9 n=1 Tax=Lithohypha guttulata TaxID=1690604 RepID=A0AAN7T018_9EURO|nr:Chromatin structure-remodeling complex protein rsc9 [Lithohypha guttulata]
MATTEPPLQTIIEDEEEFLKDAEEYMRQRGVPFDREGKVAGRPAPLHRLYTLVMERGGYDAVSDTRMAWREICSNFNFPKAHDGAMSYQLKQLYYKNLAAYEIEKYWGETPPPPSLLEHTTAKGGDVRKRTHEAMTGILTSNNQDSDEMMPDTPQHTPKQERPEADDQGSATRYPSRLRQQPKPVQLYQPDPTTSRATRMRTTHSPQPATIYTQHSFANNTSNPRDPNFKIENYEPRPSIPLTLRPLITPSSNSDVFYQRKAMSKMTPVQRTPLPQDLLRFTLPKSTFDGPNIYVRCVQGLKSGIQREQEFALHHLVKVSHERGDKFKFEGFPTLAEALMEKAIEVAELAFGVSFQVSYMEPRGRTAENVLNAVHGTENLIHKLSFLSPSLAENEIEPKDYVQRLERVNEATLVIRNMVTLEENALFLSRMALFRDLLILLLNLPRQSRFDEIRQYALDMAEMTTRYWNMAEDDELYQSLVRELASGDRGKIVRALGAIYRFDAEADRVHPIEGIPLSTFEELVRCCMLEDDEFIEAIINFLYAWSAFPDDLGRVLRIPAASDGKFQSKDVQVPEGGYTCKWINCHKHNAIDTPGALGRHLRMHVPENAEQNRALIYRLAGERPEAEKGVVNVPHTFLRTAVDEKGYPMGTPFMSALLLRNLARYVGRHGGSEQQRKELMNRLFDIKVRENLWTAFSKQTTICVLILEIIDLIQKGEATEKKSVKAEEMHDPSLF